MSNRSGAALLARALVNVATMEKTTVRCRRKAARAVWMAGAGCDFTGWDVLDGGDITEGELKGLGIMRGPKLVRSKGGEDELRDMKTGEWPQEKKSATVKLAERVAAARCPACGEPWGLHNDGQLKDCRIRS